MRMFSSPRMDVIMDCDDRGLCYFDEIPEEIISKILRWLPVKDLCNAILVCKHWRTISLVCQEVKLPELDSKSALITII